MAMDIARAGAPIYRRAHGPLAQTGLQGTESALAGDWANLPGTLWLVLMGALMVMGLVAALALLLR
jgi:hypothetical protein